MKVVFTNNITTYSYGLAFIAYFLFAIGLAVFWRNRSLSRSILICVILTTAWAAVIASGTSQTKLIEAAEAVRNGAWMFFLHSIYGMRLKGTKHILAYRSWLPLYSAGILLVLLHLFALPFLFEYIGISGNVTVNLNYVMWVGWSLAALIIVEQIYRLSHDMELWSIKYLCLGLGVLFGYDFLMYTKALILQDLDQNLWQARGAVVALTAPLIVVAVKRSMKLTAEVRVSRHVVFHSFTLLMSGAYLIYMSAVGYAIVHVGGSWGGVLQVTFFVASGLVFIALVMSAKFRDLIRVWLSKHFFSYRYDYRKEWLEFTRILAESTDTAPLTVIRAMAKLCGSPSGLLWMRLENGGMVLADYWQMEPPALTDDSASLAKWLEERLWIIDLDEWRNSPQVYDGLVIPKGWQEVPRAWLIVPLMFADRLQGILLLTRPEVTPDMNWEDRDLLKVAGRAAATHLAHYQANSALLESRQFEAFNRLSAYVVHDLKNILSQQSLILFNADDCRNEPRFLDDVLETIGLSVDSMERLMAQMRSGERGIKKDAVDVTSILQMVMSRRSHFTPVPRLINSSERSTLFVDADEEQLKAVFSHLIQNAQEAAAVSEYGMVAVTLSESNGRVKIDIKDTGPGMSEDFVKSRLFKPFDTTKGLAGMGVGAYESREYIRQIGGDVLVDSQVGKGSLVTVIVPLISDLSVVSEYRGVAGG